MDIVHPAPHQLFVISYLFLTAACNGQILTHFGPNVPLCGTGCSSWRNDAASETKKIVDLMMEEELLATKRARGDAVRLAYEYAKECLRFVDGVEVRTSNGTADQAWARMHPKVRNLVMRGYQILHQPQEKEDSDFLESHEVKVG